MKKVVLIRHGESEGNQKGFFTGWIDVPLTDYGRVQALKLKEKLNKYSFDSVYSSDLQRAYETATIVCDEKFPIITKDELFREKHFGELEGLKFDEICEKYSDIVEAWENKDYDHPTPNGESFKEFYDRIINRFQIIKDSEEKCTLIFAHSGVIQAILANEIVGDISGCWRFKVENCKVIEIEFDCDTGYCFINKLNV